MGSEKQEGTTVALGRGVMAQVTEPGSCIVQLWLCPIWRLAGRRVWREWVAYSRSKWFVRNLVGESGMVDCF